MKDHPSPATVTTRRSVVRQVVREAVLVTVVGGVFALTANHFSSRGLMVTRNYFPDGTGTAMRAIAGTSTNATGLASPPPGGTEESKELQWIDGHQTVELFHNSHLKQGVIVFVDARDEKLYQGGHVPGAYEFDPYQPEKYFPAVLPACQAAEQIVVYCNGGDCDDSKSAALLFRNVGIPNRKLFIYAGGITDWSTNHQPVETGARNSGKLSITIQ